MCGKRGEVEERRAGGKALRQKVQRRDHAVIGNVDRDPILLLEERRWSVSRLVPCVTVE
jgi:hypothetical protein